MSINDGRLVATDRKLTKEDFDQLASEMGVVPGLAKKLGDKPVAAMQIVDVYTPVITINTQDGTVQAEKMAKPGDAIMTRLNKDGSPKFGSTGELDQWVVDADKLGKLYNKLGQTSPYGDVVGGNNEVLFVHLPKGGEIVAPWGGTQQISEGVLQYSLTTNEVYLNETDGFKTFAVERDVAPIRPEQKVTSEHPKPSNG